MIVDFISGIVAEKRLSELVVEAAGVGHRIHILPTLLEKLPPVGKPLKIFIHDHVREDSLDYYGFLTAYDRDVFELLLEVSGVGPKLGLRALAETHAEDLIRFVYSGDENSLGRIKGIGPKLAAKMVLELKKKAGAYLKDEKSGEVAAGDGGEKSQVELALKNLGYRDAEIRPVLARVFASGMNTTIEDAIRACLKELGKI